MSLPSGVTAATLVAKATKTTPASPIGITVAITPSVNLTHAVAGTKLSTMIETLVSGPGLASRITVPHTNQAGFVDDAGVSVTSWFYIATFSYTLASGARAYAPRSTPFLLPTTAPATVELETLPVPIPLPPADPDVPEADLPPRLSAVSLAAAIAAGVSPKMASTQRGAASGVAPLDSGSRVPVANLPANLAAAALNATYVTFRDSVTGLPLTGKHVVITVDQTTDEIVATVVEAV